jgi:hypothetical protein
VKVTNEGNVIPWLMATKALVHNGCTTGVEAYIMKVPAVTYMATRNEYYDYGYFRLPNTVSHRCDNFEQLQKTLSNIFSGALGPADGNEQEALMQYHLEAQSGPLACDRITDVIEKILESRPELPKPPPQDLLNGWYRANRRRLVKWYKSHLPNSKYRPEYQRHRYPGLSLHELQERISRIRQLLGDNIELKVEPISDYIFRISV